MRVIIAAAAVTAVVTPAGCGHSPEWESGYHQGFSAVSVVQSASAPGMSASELCAMDQAQLGIKSGDWYQGCIAGVKAANG